MAEKDRTTGWTQWSFGFLHTWALDSGNKRTSYNLSKDALDELDIPSRSEAENAEVSRSEEANAAVYKLVRVDGDGTLVLTTEEEVMKVEHFLETQEQNIAKNAGGCSYLTDMSMNLAMEDLPSSDNDDENENVTELSEPEDLEAERRKLNAKLEFLDVMLQRVKEEERLRRASGISPHTSSYLTRKHGWNHFDGNFQENLANPVLNSAPLDACFEKNPCSAYGKGKTHTLEHLNVDDSCPSTKSNIVKDAAKSAPLLTAGSPKPDLNTAKSGISLESLSIRELHDTFRATFGRETLVKDKQWLKRRISIALANSYMKTCKQEDMNSHEKSQSEQSPTDSVLRQATKSKVAIASNDVEAAGGRPLVNNSWTTFLTDIVPKEEIEMSNDDVPLGEEITRKRMRKPTKRYIEELSGTDARLNSGKQAIASRDSDQGNSTVKSRVGYYWNGFEGMTLMCREDSLGNCGIQVPFVFRVRRGRPRKNCSTLLKHKPSERATKLVKKALRVRAARCSTDNVDTKQLVPFVSSQKFQVHDDKENKEHILASLPMDRKFISKTSDSDTIEDNSDNYVSTIRTAKGGIRRKHHRSWTLQEVVRLVEGVSRFGVGRWSDIKKLAFSTPGYRTSVDLKDKWRNLLRASYSQLQTKEAVNRRKHTSVSIPAPILARVRELSAMQSRALCAPNSSNSVSRSGRIVHKRDPM